jgi:multiple sugar transport system substrate-binding protein
VISRRALLASGVVLLAGAGCKRARSTNELRIAYAPTTLTGMYEAIAKAFVAAHPEYRVALLPCPTYSGVMQRDFRLALVGDEPDVSHIGINHVRFYAERALAQPLDSWLAAEHELAVTSHPSIGKVAGITRALPFAISVPVTYFNKTLLLRAGQDPERLQSGDWPEIVQAATAVSRLGHPNSGIFFDYTSEAALGWQMLVLSRGGHMMTADETSIAFADQAGLWSAELLRQLGAAGQIDMSRDNARMAFLTGTLGCYQNTSANITRFAANIGNFEMGVAPLPVAPGGRLPAAGNAVVITTRDKARQQAAWRYIRFVTGPVGQTLMAKATGYLSLNRHAVSQPEFLEPVLQESPFYRALYSRIGLLDAWYAFPGPRSEQISDVIKDHIRSILLGRVQPSVALARMAAQAQALVDRR